MRISSALLCFSLLFSAAAAAEPSSPTAADTYISARNQATAKVCAIKDVKSQDQALDRALPELERLMAAAVPAWQGPGFPSKSTYTVQALCPGDIELGLLDGRAYRFGDTTVTVTTKPLLGRWLSDHRNWWKDEKNIPASMTAAFRAEAFYTQALSTDAAAYLHGMVLVKAPQGADLAVVELATFAQDLVLDRGPTTLLAVVLRGDRVFIAEEKLKTPLAPAPFCKKTMDLTLAHAKAVADAKNNDQSDALEEKADREYRDCFGVRLREQPNYAAVQKQAQALVDLLH